MTSWGDQPRWLVLHQDAVDQVRQVELPQGEFLGGDLGERRLLLLADHLLDGPQLGLRLGQHHARRLRLGVGQEGKVMGEFEEAGANMVWFSCDHGVSRSRKIR
ncbi:MAG: hypothetical protein R3B91_18915 [Planctomycetaceae bacterium]